MRKQGIDIDNYSKTVHIEGDTIHMQAPPSNTITLKQLEAIKAAKMKKG